MTVEMMPTGSPAPARRISVAVFLGIVALYLVVLQVVGRLATVGLHEDFGQFTSTEEVTRGLLLAVGLSLILVYGTVAFLGWRRPVLVDDRPVQRWVWAIPAILAISIVAAINYGGLGDKSSGFVVLLVLGTQMVGFAGVNYSRARQSLRWSACGDCRLHHHRNRPARAPASHRTRGR